MVDYAALVTSVQTAIADPIQGVMTLGASLLGVAVAWAWIKKVAKTK